MQVPNGTSLVLGNGHHSLKSDHQTKMLFKYDRLNSKLNYYIVGIYKNLTHNLYYVGS